METCVNSKVARRTLSAVLALVVTSVTLIAWPLHAAAATLTWSGNSGIDSNWSTPSNWVGGIAPTSGDGLIFPAGAGVNHLSNDDIVGLSVPVVDIDDNGYGITGSTNLAVAISVSMNAVGTSNFAPPIQFSTLNVTAIAGAQLRITGAMTGGAGTLNLSGPGTISLGTDSTYTTATNIVNSARVIVNSASPFGTSPLSITPNGSLEIATGSTIANNLLLDSPVTIQADAFGTVLSGPISMFSGSPEFHVLAGARLDLSGRITGAGGAGPAFSGPAVGEGVVRLNGAAANSWTGATLVGFGGGNNVNVIATDPPSIGAAAVTVANGAALTLDTTVSAPWPNAFTVAGNGGSVSGALGFTGVGTATVSGTVTVAAAGATFGDAIVGPHLTGTLTGTGPLVFTGLGAYTIAGAASNTDTGAVNVSNNGGVILNTAGTALATTNLTATSQPVILGAANQLPAAAAVHLVGAATLGLAGFAQTLDTLTYAGDGGTTTDGALTISTLLSTSGNATTPDTLCASAAGTVTLSGATVTVAAGGSGGTDLIIRCVATASPVAMRDGAGILQLTAASPANMTATAGTTLVAGQINAFTAQTGSTLGGTGSVFTLTASGGTVAPGNFGPGSMLGFATTFNAGSTYQVQVNGTTSGTQYDTLATFANTIGGSLQFVLGYVPTVGDSYTIVSSFAGSGTFAGLPQGAIFLSSFGGNSYPFSIDYVGAPGHNTVVTALAALPTATTLTSDLNPAGATQNENLTATVTSSGPGVTSGTVNFFDGATLIGSATVNGSGVATLAVNLTAIGSHSLTAQYVATTAFATSTSGVLAETIQAPIAVPVTGSHASTVAPILWAPALMVLASGAALIAVQIRRRRVDPFGDLPD